MSAATYENAIHAAVVSASGLSDQNVFWESQTIDHLKPGVQFATLKITSEKALGSSFDTLLTFEPESALGEEIRQEYVFVRELVLSLQIVGGTTVGVGSARDIATKLQRKLQLPATQEVFNGAGLSLINAGDVQNLPEILDAGFEARAVLSLTFYLRETEVTRTGYIDSAEIENEVNDEIIIVETSGD